MLIVKPYGRTVTVRDGTGVFERKLDRTGASSVPIDIPNFARTHDELVIAQWVSIIDKVATKPAKGKSPTDEQRSLRKRIGEAAWAHLVAKGLLPGLGDAESAARLAKLWQMKIAPYGNAKEKLRPERGTPRSAKGRSYLLFAGASEPDHADAIAIAAKIDRHLYDGVLGKTGKTTRRGLIETRAKSIAENVLRPAQAAATWSEANATAYVDAGDVAKLIREAVQRRERGKDDAPTLRVANDVAGPVLYEHWQKLFVDDDGSVLGVKGASDQHSGLFALHMAVKDFYVRRLKHHGKKAARKTKDRQGNITYLEGDVLRTLPTDWASLLRHIGHGRRNRDLNGLVRLGKVIHYEMSDGAADATSNIVGSWPANFSDSRFWTSPGQAEIKRNEAFVRVWRHVLALAARTLTDWCNPAINKDILVAIDEATVRQFDRGRYGAKCPLLFGNQEQLFVGSENFERSILRTALCGTASLRHKAFHFAGRGGFVAALEGMETSISGGQSQDVAEAISRLWSDDRLSRAARLRATMAGAHLGNFYGGDQVRYLYQAVTSAPIGQLPLPRFSRVLNRSAETVLEGEQPALPPPVNRHDLENDARLCAYTALKLVYEKPFRAWLGSAKVPVLNGFIDQALVRGTAEARRMNGQDKEWISILESRAASLGHLKKGETVHNYLDRLTAATATEMRVQAAYQSDGEQARKQAAYIEKFKCEIVALALRAYLDEAGFSFLLDPTPPARADRFDPVTLPDPSISGEAKNWQRVLYLVLHLVPVEEVGRLLHQLRKWAVLVYKGEGSEVPRDSIDPVLEVLELYLDMHDAKFEGGAALVGTEAFRSLFETRAAFDALFPAQIEGEDRRVPRRGLREIMRFGHLPVLLPIFENEKVPAADVTTWLATEAIQNNGLSQVALRQQQREALHEKWIKAKDANASLNAADRRAYAEAVRDITLHRRLSARVTLSDHVHLHRLLMGVLGRLVDFSGLWERDLYFTTLALVHEQGGTLQGCFSGEGLSALANGQIIDALDKADAQLCDQLAVYFREFKPRGRERTLRNNFAHFNLLRSASVDLTTAVNEARRLLRHDRKLTNAVSGAVIDLLAREGLELSWEMNARQTPHRLGAAKVKPRQATHLAKEKLFGFGQKDHGNSIEENMHGEAFVAMVANMFCGKGIVRPDITSLDLNRIDWQKTRPDKPSQHGAKQKKRDTITN